MKRSVVLGLWVCVVIAASAGNARAQMSMGTFKGYLTGHVGVVTSGDVTSERQAAGASVSVNESDGWGAELDFGRATDVPSHRQTFALATYFVNASLVKPRGVIRPFAIAGVGIMQIDGCGSACVVSPRSYDLGLSAGGGAFVAVTDYAAIRADARYFFSTVNHPELSRPDHFAFWRVSIGATFIWSIEP